MVAPRSAYRLLVIVGIVAVLSPSALGQNVKIAITGLDPVLLVAPAGHDYSWDSCLHYGWGETGYDYGGFLYAHSQSAVQSCDYLWVHAKISNTVPLLDPHVRARAWGGVFSEYVPSPAFWQARLHLWGCIEAWMSDPAAPGRSGATVDVTFTAYNWEKNPSGDYDWIPETSGSRRLEVQRTSGMPPVKLTLDNLVVDLQLYTVKSGYKQLEVSVAGDVYGSPAGSAVAAVGKVGVCENESDHLLTWFDYIVGDRSELP